MNIGGTETQIVRLACGLRRRDVDLHVVTAVAGPLDGELGCEVHRVPPMFKYDASVFARFAVLCRRLRPDVIQTFLTQMDIVGGAAGFLLGTPWILSERSSAGAYPPSARHRLRVAIGGRADAIVANSPGGAEYWHSVAPRHGRVCVIPNIVPHREIEGAPSLPPSSSSDVILFAGRLSAEKNLFTFLEALQRLFLRRDVVAVIAGDGYLRRDMEHKAQQLGIAHRTKFLGNVENVWSWMKSAAVMVAISTFEGNPNVVLEAAVAGVPLVLSDIPGYRAVVPPNAAFYVDGSSPDSVASGLEQALADRPEALRRGLRARQAMNSRSEDDVAMQYANLYREVIAERRK